MKKAHFIGLCGVGMGATATLLQEKGYSITGSDQGCHPPMSDYLRDRHISIAEGYRKENIPEEVDLVVAGASAKLDPSQNEEVRSAHERGIPIKTFPEILGELSEKQETILAVGSFGKSTVATLAAWCLYHAGKDPSYFIGALPLDLPAPAHLGGGDTFVLEGDEYLTSGIDRRSKFEHLKADNVILISGEHDHVNIFPTTESYLKPFKKLLARVPDDGIIMACTDNAHVAELIKPHAQQTRTYGLAQNALKGPEQKNSPDWSVTKIVYGQTTAFDLTHRGEVVCTLSTTLLGAHNIQNIAGVAALLLEKKLLTPQEIQSAIAQFHGLTRRLDSKTERSNVRVYEGFGSSYQKARAAIEAMKTHFPDKRLIVVFEPYSFSWRNKDKLHWYDDVFADCDHALIYQPPQIGTGSHDQVTHEEILKQAAKNADVSGVTSEKEGLELLQKLLKPDDIVLLLTSGNLGGLITSIPELAEKLFPA